MFIGFFALCSAPLTKVGFGTCLFFLGRILRASTHMLSWCVSEIVDYRWPPIAVNRSLSAEINFQSSTLNFMLRPEHRIQFLWHQKAYCPLRLYVWRPLYRFIFIAYEMRWQIQRVSEIFEYWYSSTTNIVFWYGCRVYVWVVTTALSPVTVTYNRQ